MRLSSTRVRQLLYVGVSGYIVWFFLVLGTENSVILLKSITELHLFLSLLIVSTLFGLTFLAIERLETGRNEGVS